MTQPQLAAFLTGLTARLAFLATHDPLTQLPNRTLFLDHLAAACAAQGTRVGLCFLDLDGFKVVNDRLGHAAGDRLLVEIAARLDRCVSAAGHLVARLGGDEFVVLVAGSTGPGQMIRLAEQILAALTPPVLVDEHELPVSASIGIVERPVAGSAPADLLRAADVTLYWAKADGKGRWSLFDPVRNALQLARYSLAAAMPAALARGEFMMRYEPVVRLVDGALLGVDAQPRWHHRRVGPLGFDQFAPLAEETGLILPLGRWAMDTACRQLSTWRDRVGDDFYVSVRIGGRQCRDPWLVEDVTHVLDSSGLRPAQLQLELTRSAHTTVAGEPSPPLIALARKGVRIALGDFGPGHANLACLRGLTGHTLKLNEGFVQTMATRRPDPVDERIVAAIISLAHGLGLAVTAEGLDGPAQVSRLRALGCDNGQGRFLAPAGPADRVARLLRGGGHPGSGAIRGEVPAW